MGGEWVDTELQNVSARTERSFAMGPFGSNIKAENYRETGVPVIRGTNLCEVGGAPFVAENFVYLDEAKANELASSNCAPGDIVFVAQGTVGKVGIVPSNTSYSRFVLSQNLMKVTVDPSTVDPRFVFYFYRSAVGQQEIMSRVNPTGVPCISKPLTSLRQFRIRLPIDVNEQRAIADILGTLDAKIELLRKQNETLEAMARALFKAWFVDFEPVRAKMEGRWQRGQSLPGLPAHLYHVFPDRLIESEQGEIPEGWSIRRVGDFADLKGGKQLEKEQIASVGEIPVFGGAGVMGFTQNYNADGFVIVIGRVGAYCGQFFSHRGKAWINNNASLVKQKTECFGEWLFLCLCHADIEVIKKGAAQPFVSNGDIAKLPLLWPGERVVQSFSENIVSLLKKQEFGNSESKRLAQLRDTLLPKLISGDLRVKDAERFLRFRGLA